MADVKHPDAGGGQPGKPAVTPSETPAPEQPAGRETLSDALKKKLERLKKKDPNIYPLW